MTDYRTKWLKQEFTNKVAAYTFANKRREEAEAFIDTHTGLGYNDAFIRMTEEPQFDGAVRYIVEYLTFEKIPFALSLSRKVDGDALKTLPTPQRNILTSKIVSDDWDLRKWKWRLPDYLRKGRMKGGGQDVKDD